MRISSSPDAEKQYLLDVVPEFFARNEANEPMGCSRAAGRLDFLHAPLFATHGPVRISRQIAA